MANKNMFGGLNPNGLYVPMSDDEKEVIQRLDEQKEFEIIVHGWGKVENPRVHYGDLRVSFLFWLNFDRPPTPMAVPFFDLELKLRSGQSLFRERLPTQQQNTTLMVMAGMSLELAWDIAIHHMDPKLVKAIKPGAIGLTTKRIDKDTGNVTLHGNMKPTNLQHHGLIMIGEGERKVREETTAEAIKLTKESGGSVKTTDKGVVLSEVK